MDRPTVRRILHACTAAATMAAAIPALWQVAYPAMFSRYFSYDDEGYLLVSLAGYMDGHALYDAVFSQYGPFHYQLLSGIFEATGAVTSHDGGRLVTLAIWLVASVGAGVAAYLFTRSVLLAIGAEALAFVALFTVTNEPLHPGAVLSLLLVFLASVVALLPRARRTAWSLAGALAAAMALVKVNVGGLAIIGLLVAAVVGADTPRWSRWAAAAAAAMAPFLLMAPSLGEAGVLSYAVVVASAAAAVGAMAMRSDGTAPWRRTIPWLAGGTAAAAAAILAAALVQGSSLRGLVDGVLLRPLGQAEAFTLRLVLFPQVVVWAIVAAGTGIVVASVRRRLPAIAMAVVRVTAGLAMWLALGGAFGPSVPAFAIGIPMAWVVLLGDDPDRRVALCALALLAVLQSLHAYPVAGSQTAWSGLLLAPLGAVAIGLGIRDLASGQRDRRRLGVIAAGFLPVVALLAWLVLGPMTSTFHAVRAGYLGWSPSGLPGAERLRMDNRTIRRYTRVTSFLREECRTFYSWPGMNSLYLWAEQSPPSLLNATTWPTLFEDDLQRRVVDDLRGTEGLCLVRNRGLETFWLQGEPSPSGPLSEYLETSFEPQRRVGSFELLVRPS